MTPDVFVQAAAAYAERGLAVLPLEGKDPVFIAPGVHMGAYKASRDPKQHEQWARLYPGCNLGVAIPSGAVCFDVDPRNGGSDEHFHGSNPICVQRSGGGGWHIFYDLDPQLRIPDLQGINVKSFGGYVVAAPSTHPETGRPYEWISEPPLTRSGAHPPPPAMMARAVRRSDPRDASSEHKALTAAAEYVGMRDEAAVMTVPNSAVDQAVAAVESIALDGQKYTVVTKMAALLARRGWDQGSVTRFAHEFCIRYGAKDVNHGIRGAIGCMNLPSGYYDLLALAGNNSLAVQYQLDKVFDPFNAEYVRARQEATAKVTEALAAARSNVTAQPPPSSYDDIELPEPPELEQHRLGRRVDLSAELPPMEYCVDGLPWHYDAVNAIVGFANSGKTPFGAALCVALANGATFLGRQCQKGKVLILAFESPRGLARQLQRYARANKLGLSDIDFIEADAGKFVTDPGYLDAIRATVAAGGYRHVFIDTYNAACSGADVNESKFAAPARALEMSGVATFFVLHTSKADRQAPTLYSIAGTGGIAGALKSAVGIWRPEEGAFEAVCVRTPERSFDPIRYAIVDAPNGWSFEEREAPAAGDAEISSGTLSVSAEVDSLVKKIPTLYSGQSFGAALSLRDLVVQTRASSDKTVSAACARLLSLGVLNELRDGKVRTFVLSGR